MTDLWTTAAGRAATKILIYSLIRRRMKRFFKRKFVVQYDAWIQSGKTAFSFLNTLGDLNTYHDTEILNLYELLMVIGEMPETLEPVNFWVSENGDDINGLGNADSPFATVGRALGSIENTIINHGVTIYVQNDNAPDMLELTDDTWYMPNDLRDGYVTIVGVGQPHQVLADVPLTGKTALGAGGIEFAVAGVPWVANRYISDWMVAQDGAAQDVAVPIHHNTTSQIRTYARTTSPAIADTIQIQQPSITIKLNRVKIATRGTIQVDAGWLGSRISICNLILDFQDSTDEEGLFAIWKGEQIVWLDFVKLVFADGHTGDIVIQNAWVNGYEPVDQQLGLKSCCGIANVGTWESPGFTALHTTKALGVTTMAYLDECNVRLFSMPDGVESLDSRIVMQYSAVGRVNTYNPAFLDFSYMLNSNNSGIGFDCSYADLRINACHIMAPGTRAIRISNGRTVIGLNTTCDPALTGCALECDEGAHVSIDNSLATLVGAAGAINFTAPNPDVVAAWPAAGAIVGDAIGGAGVHSAWVVQPG